MTQGRAREDELLKSCLTGSEEAWTIFVGRFAYLVRWAIRVRILRSRLAIDETEIDDIFQQIFTDIWRNNRLRALKSARSLSSWLVIVSQNAAINFARKKIRLPQSQAEDLGEYAAQTSSNPRTEAHSSQLDKTVEELVSALPLKERRIISLELFYDLKHREIANIMSIPINTVSTIIARVKGELRDKLTERGYDV